MKGFRAKGRKNVATVARSQTSRCQNRTCSPEGSCWPEQRGMGPVPGQQKQPWVTSEGLRQQAGGWGCSLDPSTFPIPAPLIISMAKVSNGDTW